MMDYLDFIIKMQSIAKIGLTFSKDPYAIENYQQIQDISREMLEKYTNEIIEEDNMFVRDIYPTPNISVRVLVEEEGKILVVRERVDQRYSIPGGWCDMFESIESNAKAELLQETGYNVELIRPLAIFNRGTKQVGQSEYCIIFSGKIIGGEARISHETDEVLFLEANKIPILSGKNTQEELDIILDIYYNNKNTYFD